MYKYYKQSQSYVQELYNSASIEVLTMLTSTDDSSEILPATQIQSQFDDHRDDNAVAVEPNVTTSQPSSGMDIHTYLL